MASGSGRTYGVDLLYERAPAPDPGQLLARVRAVLPQTELVPGHEGGGWSGSVIQFAHLSHPVRFADGGAYAVTAVISSNEVVDPAVFEAAAGQTWDWPDAGEALHHCRHRVHVTDLFSSTLPYKERLNLRWAAVRAVSETIPPLVCHWQPAQRLVNPAALGDDPLDAALNVRLFRIEGAGAAQGEVLMDTLGLAALGLPDLQCHFRGLEAGRVAGWLYSAGRYVYEHGDAIEDGHTIQGLEPDQRWRCRHEEALAGPERVVIDVDPGPAYAAGRRTSAH